MRKTHQIIFTAIVSIMLLCMMACQDGSANLTGTAKSITVVVLDRMASKSITPSGEAVDITHYKITVTNEAEGINETSTWLAKDESFTVSNVPAGMWKATVDAYVKNGSAGTDDDYIKVASATSTETRVEADQSATLTVTLDTLIDALSGDITVTLDMPTELDDENDTFYYTYTIAGTGQRSEYSYTMDTPTQRTVDGSGNGTFTIDANAISPQLNQGAYLLTVTVFDQATEEASNVVRKGVEIMRLLPGLSATGTINLNSQIVSESGFQVAVTDKIGNLLNLGNAEYSDFSEDLTIIIDYKDISTDTPVSVYVDGEMKNVSTDFTTSVSGSSFSFIFSSMSSGRHIVTFILDESDTQLGVNSLSVEVNIPKEIEITPPEPSHFTYTDNGDGTCTITGENPDNPLPSHVNLEIPSEIKSLKVTAIGSEAFHRCGFTGTLTLPEGLQTLGSSAFSNNSFTGNLVIPNSVTTIDNNAFEYTKFNILTLGKNIETIGSSAFRNNSFTGTLTLPEGLKTIGDRAFWSRSFTGSLTIPDSVTAIGDSAFYQNTFNGTLTLGKNLQTIGNEAFSGLKFTGQLILPENLKTIGNSAFANNSFTGDLIIPAKVENIGENAFKGNKFTGTLTLGKNLQTIGPTAFSYNDFTGDLVIPDSVTEIGRSAFQNNSFTGTLTLGKNLQTIGNYAFDNCLFTGDLIIPDSVKTIGGNVFSGFTSTLTLGKNLKTIGMAAFSDCTFTGDLIIPANVETIAWRGIGGNFSTIYCEAESQPSGWDSDWNHGDNIPVVWGYTGE